MLLDVVQSIYAHNTWANQQVLETAAALPKDQLLAQTHPSFGSIRDALTHLVSVQRIWLARAQKQPTPASLVPDAFPDVLAIVSHWREIDAATHRFIDSRCEGDLAEVIHYVNAQGEPNAYLLWQILLHQANHAGQHRSEVALLLTQMGHSTGWLDYLVYLDEQAALSLRAPGTAGDSAEEC